MQRVRKRVPLIVIYNMKGGGGGGEFNKKLTNN